MSATKPVDDLFVRGIQALALCGRIETLKGELEGDEDFGDDESESDDTSDAGDWSDAESDDSSESLE